MGCFSCVSIEGNCSPYDECFGNVIWVEMYMLFDLSWGISLSIKYWLLFKGFWMDEKWEELEVWIVEEVLID